MIYSQAAPLDNTVENVLFKALVRVGAVSQDNSDDPVKVNLARAARTDKGVHAAGNVVSMKLITSIPGVPDWVARVNEELPPEIRVWSYVRVQNSFSAHTACDSRKYTYFFPSYLSLPPKPGSGQYNKLAAQEGVSQDVLQHGFWQEGDAFIASEAGDDVVAAQADLKRKRAWRTSPAHMERLRLVANKFLGTHNFHNFTVGRDFGDRSCHRHMKQIEIADPQVYGDTEWISVLFHGQSFMLHQRKMMSALVLCSRSGTPESVIGELYGPRNVLIPKMPSLGLLLEHPIFDAYNKHMEPINAKLQPGDAEYRPPIGFAEHGEAMESFKENFIYANMREVENRDGTFDMWIRNIDDYAGDDLLYLNPKGVVPQQAVVQKGKRREDPLYERPRRKLTQNSKTEPEEDESDEENTRKQKPSDLEG
ncbi:pseudouridine synthase [Fistulina hepatica ATCC 64428]|uniref:tRNA pseudouridine synthase 1 n=1 Tax=Fistulina hepatica ATCC 64428 TaxID=1128425 RepID=A0A0D7ANR1_9AGAR|nr:pseudouridine synthase [Fistulina hepatica ATCC 64428]